MKIHPVVLLVLGFASSSLAAVFFNPDGNPVVDVTQGRIVGTNDTRDALDMCSFKSIPYGEPPLGDLRFAKPVKAGNWTGDLDASRHPNICTQLGIGSEDCLYLNVYTPVDAITNGGATAYPVMVWIYGGGYVFGSDIVYGYVHELVNQGVIVAEMNYRVGVLGFLSTEDAAAPGNYGLWDQNLAIQWVYDNIASFGGDQSRITIFGGSSGSSSVHYQMLSPYSAGLFSQAIMQSGNAFAYWTSGREFLQSATTIANDMNCTDVSTSVAIVDCLRGVDAGLLSLQNNMADWNVFPFYFAPRVDGDFIPDTPAALVKSGNYAKVPTLTGTTRDEGAIFTGQFYSQEYKYLNDINADFNMTAPATFFLHPEEDPINTSHEIYNFYLQKTTGFDDSDADPMTDQYSRFHFQVPMDLLVELQAAETPVYLYELSYRADLSLMTIYVNSLGLNETLAENWVCHTDDLFYIFGMYTPEMTDLSGLMVKTWTNFVIHGNPTPDGSLGVVWPLATPADMSYLSLDNSLPALATVQPYSRQADLDFYKSLPLNINAILQAP